MKLLSGTRMLGTWGGALGKFVALLGWAACLAAIVIFTSQKRALESQLQSAREHQEKLVQESVTAIRSQGTAGKNQEVDKLQKDAEDVHRLRNEVKQLRDSQKEMEQLKSQNAQLQQTVSQMRQANQEIQVENSQLKVVARTAEVQRANGQQQAMRNGCIANLKQIDGAIQQWALENRKTAESRVVINEIILYLKGGRLPVCPEGGIYGATVVKDNPRCNIPGHSLD